MQTTTTTARPGVSSTSAVVLYIFAILLPPVAVFLASGCGADFLINICLTILAWIPGILHAWWVIARHERTKVVSTRTAAPVGGTTGMTGTAAVPATAQGPVSVAPGAGTHMGGAAI